MHKPKPSPLDSFIPSPEVRGRHEITIHAPAEVVMETAQNFAIESVWLVRTLIRIRCALLRGKPAPPNRLGLVEQMLGLGWHRLAEESGKYFVAGAACRPWQADPEFAPIAPENFACFAEPDRVKIAWTLETTELAPEDTRFATETRAISTDQNARRKFKKYWRKFGAGVVLIRLVLLPAMRREAEKKWRSNSRTG